jgi:hypothetical protein
LSYSARRCLIPAEIYGEETYEIGRGSRISNDEAAFLCSIPFGSRKAGKEHSFRLNGSILNVGESERDKSTLTRCPETLERHKSSFSK